MTRLHKSQFNVESHDILKKDHGSISSKLIASMFNLVVGMCGYCFNSLILVISAYWHK